jgi:membrane protein implicated in regulation of membrane protease activity
MHVEPWQLFAAVGLLLALAEFFTPSFFSLPAGLAFLVTALIAGFTDNWIALYAILAINLAIIYGIFYQFVWPRLGSKNPKTNADGMAGKIATVSEAIDPTSGGGEVKLYGDNFRVIAKETFAVGTRVMITATEGNKLVIRALNVGEG